MKSKKLKRHYLIEISEAMQEAYDANQKADKLFQELKTRFKLNKLDLEQLDYNGYYNT